MNLPRVSVVMPTYNQARYLPEALECLQRQTLPLDQMEILIIDDGSTDETARILEGMGNRFRVIRQPHQGLVAGCNAGLAAARGDLLARMDSDDHVDEKWLEELVRALDSRPDACCAYPNRWEFRGQTKTQIQTGEGNLYRLIACGTLFRTQALRAVGGFRGFFWEEYDLYLRLMRIGPFLHVQQPLYAYRKHDEGMTHAADRRREGWRQLQHAWGAEALRAAGFHPELEEVLRS